MTEKIIPDGYKLVAVKGLDELVYWLERCKDKGHLESCADLIEPFEAFEYRNVSQEAVIAAHEAKAAPAVPQGTNWHAHHVIVGKAALQMVRNALRNDMERGLIVRGEMLEELDKVTYSATPAAPSQEPALHIGACITDGVLHATVMRREANGHVTILATAEMDAKSLLEHDCVAKLSPAAPSQPAVPEIDYPELIRAAYATDKKWAQGTNGCSAFARGAEWFRDQMLAATPAAASQPVTLTDRQFDLICQAIDKADTITMEGDYMLDSDDCIGVVRVMQALFSIAAMREKEQAK